MHEHELFCYLTTFKYINISKLPIFGNISWLPKSGGVPPHPLATFSALPQFHISILIQILMTRPAYVSHVNNSPVIAEG